VRFEAFSHWASKMYTLPGCQEMDLQRRMKLRKEVERYGILRPS
jgi:hypothetical protein